LTFLYIKRIKGYSRKCRSCVFSTLADGVISLHSIIGPEDDGRGSGSGGRSGKESGVTEFFGFVDDGIKKDNAKDDRDHENRQTNRERRP